MNAILVPGRPDKNQHYDPSEPNNSQNYWLPWLQRQLILQDIHTVAVEPPFPFRPRYSEWRKEFERFDITPSTILIGHSCGGGFLLRWLSENQSVKVSQVILVAPWTNPDNYKDADVADFFDFTLDANISERTNGVTIFISKDDEPSVIKTVNLLKTNIQNIEINEYTNRGHFKEPIFNELLEAINL